MVKLSPKKERFVDEYLIDLNATQAAIRAGYSKKTASAQGARLLINVKVQEEIQQRQAVLQKKTGLTQERVLAEYEKIAFSNKKDFASWSESGLRLIDSNTLTREQTACIAEISQVSTEHGQNIKIKLHDKLRALDAIGRHLGIFTQKTETEITLNPQTAMEKLTEQLFKVKENDKQNSDDNETA